MLVIPATPEAKEEGSLESKSSRPAWATWREPPSQKKRKKKERKKEFYNLFSILGGTV